MLLVLLNRGYPSAAVDARVIFTEDRSSAAVAFVVAEGPQVFVEHVLVVGNVKTSAEMIRREVTLQPGAPLSYAELTESQRRISAPGAVPPGSHHRARSRRAKPPRPAGHRRGGAGDHGRVRRRRRRRPAAAPGRTRRRRHRGVRDRAARVCRIRAGATSSAAISRSACLRVPACAPRRPRPRWPKARRSRAATPCVTTACSAPIDLPRFLGTCERPARHRLPRAGAAIQLQLHQARRTRGADAPADPRAQLQRPLRDRAGRSCSRSGWTRKTSRSSTGCFRRCGCRRCRGPSFATRATTRWRPRAAP